MPSCKTFEGLLLEDLAGTLGAAEQGQLASHLASCKACSLEERELKQTLAWITPLGAPAEASLAGLERTTYLAWRRTEERRVGRQRFLTGVLAAAAVGVIAIVPTALRTRSQPTGVPASVAPAAQSEEDAPEAVDDFDLADDSFVDAEGAQP